MKLSSLHRQVSPRRVDGRRIEVIKVLSIELMEKPRRRPRQRWSKLGVERSYGSNAGSRRGCRLSVQQRTMEQVSFSIGGTKSPVTATKYK